MRYLTSEQILLIHSMVVDETGGSHGVRDSHAVLSLESAPKQKVFGKILYNSIYEKAAVYLREIITQHPFVDSNKRTAITVASVFLENNGYIFKATDEEVVEFALKTVEDKLEISDIVKWLKSHSNKIDKR
ncbi:MAG: type II toxin-antitoxin system death-on-curing family toxin [Candidatus Spechtbacterales bacterium]